MTKYHIVKGKNIKDLDKNIETFFKSNPGYQPYSEVYYTTDCEKPPIRYQSFVRKSHSRRKSHKNKSKNPKHKYNRKNTRKNRKK